MSNPSAPVSPVTATGGDAALAAAETAALAAPTDVRAQFALGGAALAAGRAAVAVAAFDRVLARHPLVPNAHAGRGLALAALGADDAAIDAVMRAVALDPAGATPVLVQLGHQFLQMGRPGSAHAVFGRLLALQPDMLAAQQGRVICLLAMNRHEEALPHLASLQGGAPTMDYLAGVSFHARLQCCDWMDYDATVVTLAEGVRRGERVDTPLSFIVHNGSAADQRQCAAIYAAHRCQRETALSPRDGRAGPRLRVAYLSSDLRDHAVAQVMAGVFEAHDRSAFEIHGLSSGPDDGSELRRRINRSIEHVVEVGSWSDEAIAGWIADRSIDVLVDLGGYSNGGRTRVLAFRPAPVQVGLLGYPGTLGTEYVDYIIADERVIPPAHREHFAEKVIWLPDCFFPANHPAAIETRADRSSAGLSDQAVVYCCFNALHKISPPLYDVWMRILDAVPHSLLWLREGSRTARHNLSREAERRGIDPARLRFAPRTPTRALHHARFALADIFLDTSPYGAHTTAAEALGVGVPVITLRGETFASRVAASLLASVGLARLAVDSAGAYERLAIDLGSSPASLARVKKELERARAHAPLFDPGLYCRHLETAYAMAVARHRRGDAPAALLVERRHDGNPIDGAKPTEPGSSGSL